MSPSRWLRLLAPLLQTFLALLRFATAWWHRRQGRLEVQKAQLERDHEMLRKAADSRRDVDHSVERVRRDPRNRDAH